MDTNIDNLLPAILNKDEIQIQKEDAENEVYYKKIFLGVTSTQVIFLIYLYLACSDFNSLPFILGGGLFSVIFALILLFNSISFFTHTLNTKIESEFSFINIRKNKNLFDKTSEHPSLLRKMQEILKIRPLITEKENAIFTEMAEQLSLKRKEAEILAYHYIENNHDQRY